MTAHEILAKVLEAGGRVIPDPNRPRLLVSPALKPLVLQYREALRQLLQQREEATPDLLNTPLNDLKQPLKVWSDLLGETIYLVATEADACRLMAEGEVAYCPYEVERILEIARTLPKERAQEEIRRIHQTKKVFLGKVKEVTWRD